jgi:Dolichyl-phosphate-mannose-protein mannosyltransferase
VTLGDARRSSSGLSRSLAATLGVGALKLLVSLALLAAGFRAVSDDDYARVVIAQRFAELPRLDPSGTSWLPLPFWVYGAGFRLLGVGLGAARVTAVILGVLSVLLLLGAARKLGAGRVGAVTAALVAGLFPWSAWLGAATVPEAPAAALMVYALATLATATLRDRALGAVAVAAACFCRYEAWPVAFGFAAFTTYDAARARADAKHGAADATHGAATARHVATLLVIAAVALGPVVLWLLHGTFVHGDTLFFWKRVAGYRHALGESAPLVARLLAVPRSLFGEEPELWLGLALVLPSLRRPSYLRPALVSALLLAFLAAGELSGGGPTHHAGRAALPVWYLAALALGHATGERWDARSARRGHGLALAAGIVGLGWLFRAFVPPGFPDRSAAVHIGSEARSRGAPALLIDTPDYSYFATMAAFAKPSAAAPFDDRDPRRPRPADAFASESALRARWATRPDAWLAVTRLHARVAADVGHVVTETPDFLLVAPNPGVVGHTRAPVR